MRDARRLVIIATVAFFYVTVLVAMTTAVGINKLCRRRPYVNRSGQLHLRLHHRKIKVLGYVSKFPS